MGRGRSGRMAAKPTPPTPIVNTREEASRTEVSREEREPAYHEFRDTAIIDEWNFRGDGREAVDFFKANSNYDELIKNMNRDDKYAFADYWVPGSFMRGQMYNGFAKLSAREQQYVRSYDKILDQSVIREGFTVRRQSTAEFLLGKGNEFPRSLEQLRGLKGKTITSIANMSTAAAGRGLAIGRSERKAIEYVMKFPPNSKGAGMWIGDTRINHFGVRQREFMTNRDIQFRVGDTKYNPRTRKYEVELIYVGRKEHDYGSKR